MNEKESTTKTPIVKVNTIRMILMYYLPLDNIEIIVKSISFVTLTHNPSFNLSVCPT